MPRYHAQSQTMCREMADWTVGAVFVVFESNGSLDPCLQCCGLLLVGGLEDILVDGPIHTIPHVVAMFVVAKAAEPLMPTLL